MPGPSISGLTGDRIAISYRSLAYQGGVLRMKFHEPFCGLRRFDFDVVWGLTNSEKLAGEKRGFRNEEKSEALREVRKES